MRDKIHWTWKKIVGIIAGLLGIGTLVSCYGMPMADVYVSGTVTSAETGEPIPNIEVYSMHGGSTYTDANGHYEFIAEMYRASGRIYFADVDYKDNGGFYATTQLPISEDSKEYDIALNKAKVIHFGGKVTSEENGTPIKGIEVVSNISKYHENLKDFTDEDGNYEIDAVIDTETDLYGYDKYNYSYVEFRDIDDEENGHFWGSKIKVSEDMDNTLNNDVSLEKYDFNPEEE